MNTISSKNSRRKVVFKIKKKKGIFHRKVSKPTRTFYTKKKPISCKEEKLYEKKIAPPFLRTFSKESQARF